MMVHPVVFMVEQAWTELMAADRAAGRPRWRPRKTVAPIRHKGVLH